MAPAETFTSNQSQSETCGQPQYSRYNEAVEDIRVTEYPHMSKGVYLDHGGATIYSKSLVSDFSEAMLGGLWGNPHSDNLPARSSGDMVDDVRARALRFLGADPRDFDLVFVANATAAIKLVAGAFRDLGEKTAEGGFWLGYHGEVHSSILGARQLGWRWHCFDTDAAVDQWLGGGFEDKTGSKPTGLGLFAWPGQSNLSGRRLPRWAGQIRAARPNTYTLFDAAALAMTSSLESVFQNPDEAPDFTSLSFYKIFGFPDLGALVVRRSSGHILTLRKYFGGGTIAQLFPFHSGENVTRKGPATGPSLWDLHDGLEDGTLPFHSILALGLALNNHLRIFGPMDNISRHCSYLGRLLYENLASLRHPDGSRLAEMYVNDPSDCGNPEKQGGTVAFNIKTANGTYVPWNMVEKMANEAGVYIRAGGVCCPGGVAKALRYEPFEWSRMFSTGHSCGRNEMAVVHGKPTGIVRASVGAMSTANDVRALVDFLRAAFLAKPCPGGEATLLTAPPSPRLAPEVFEVHKRTSSRPPIPYKPRRLTSICRDQKVKA